MLFRSTLVFFVSPKKINKIIPEIKRNFVGRKILLCREITKFYEDYIRKNVDDLDLFEKELKGEITIVISEKLITKNNSEKLSESDKNIIKQMIKKFSLKEITNLIRKNKKILHPSYVDSNKTVLEDEWNSFKRLLSIY